MLHNVFFPLEAHATLFKFRCQWASRLFPNLRYHEQENTDVFEILLSFGDTLHRTNVESRF